MFRLGLLLTTLSLLLTADAQAIQLGDGSGQVVAQYGVPSSGDLPPDHGMGTYRWNGWRLDVEIIQGTVQRLIFTKEATPFSEAEENQLLQDNGGAAAWQPTDHVAADTLAVKRWHRVSDGAEAFTLAGDGRVMCLATKRWAETWTRAHAPVVPPPSAPQSSRAALTALNQPPQPEPPPSGAAVLGGLVLLAGCAGFVVFLAYSVIQALRRRWRASSTLPSPLWSVSAEPRQLKSACTVSASPSPPPLPPAAEAVPAPSVPKSRSLTDLSWQEFELVTGELYRRQGYTVALCAGDGADGGVDLRLHKDGQTTLVQCKHWKAYKVRVSTARELFGILTAEKADHAVLVTTGRFTPDARAFAAGKPLELIDGAKLQGLVGQFRRHGQGDLLDVASWSAHFAHAASIIDPLCPHCHSAMVLRTRKQSSERFWGCPAYPRCRGTRNVRLELMKMQGGFGIRAK